MAGLLVVAVSRTTTVRVPPRRRGGSIVAELRTGFDSVIGSPLMRLVAVAYVLLAILGSSVTVSVPAGRLGTFTTEADLATALGLLSASVTATSFVVSLLVANRVYARFGVAGAALVLPLVYLGGFGLWIVAFSMTTAAVFRFTQQIAQRGLSNAAWSAFYNVVPSERRARSSPSTTASLARSGRSCRGCCCSRPAPCWHATRSSGWARSRPSRASRRRRHPAAIRGEPAPDAAGRSR